MDNPVECRIKSYDRPLGIDEVGPRYRLVVKAANDVGPGFHFEFSEWDGDRAGAPWEVDRLVAEYILNVGHHIQGETIYLPRKAFTKGNEHDRDMLDRRYRTVTLALAELVQKNVT